MRRFLHVTASHMTATLLSVLSMASAQSMRIIDTSPTVATRRPKQGKRKGLRLISNPGTCEGAYRARARLEAILRANAEQAKTWPRYPDSRQVRRREGRV